jgi:hypothetical protein
MKLLFGDTKAIIIKQVEKGKWDTVCATEYRANGEWMCGMNMITSIEDVLNTAEKNKGVVVDFESHFKEHKE